MQSGKSNATLCNQCANMDTEKKKKSFHIFIIKHNMYTLLSIVGLFTDSEIPLDKTPLKGVTEAKFLGPFLPAHYLPKDTFST